MKQEKQQAIALMRYGAIAPLIAGLDEDYPSKTAFYMELSTKGLVGPDGRVHHYAPSTIEKWYLDYQNHGFDALIPKGRSDAGMSRKLMMNCRNGSGILKRIIHACRRQPFTDSSKMMVSS